MLSLALFLSLLLAAAGLCFHQEFLQLLYRNVEVSVMTAADTYFVISLCSIPCIAIHQACSAMFRSMNTTRIPLYTVILLNLTNILGNYLAVYVLQAGVLGIALATVLARIVGNILMLYLAMQKKFMLHISFAELWKPEFC